MSVEGSKRIRKTGKMGSAWKWMKGGATSHRNHQEGKAMHFYANNRRVTPQDIYREFEHVSKDVAARIREFLENGEKSASTFTGRQTNWPVADLCENEQ